MKRLISSIISIVMISMSLNAGALPVLVEDVLERPTDHRPVPTEFTKSKALDDLHYFPMPEDGDKVYESLSGGEVVISGDDLFYEGATIEGKEHGKIEVVDVEGMPFTKALRMTTDKLPSTHSGYNYRIYPDDFEKFTKFKDGDQLLATFYVRKITGGDIDTNLSSVYAYFCEKSWVKSNDGRQYQTIEFGSEWKRAYVPINLNHEYGEAGFVFSLNPIYYTGVIEIGGLEMVNYGTNKDVMTLPSTFIKDSVTVAPVISGEVSSGTPSEPAKPAQKIDGLPDGGILVVDSNEFTKNIKHYENGFAKIAFDSDVLKVDVHTLPDKDLRVYSTVQKDISSLISKGDVCIMVFEARLISGGEEGTGYIKAWVQDKKSAKALFARTNVGKDWTMCYLPFEGMDNIRDAGMRFGGAIQKLEIRNFYIINYKDKATISQLPSTIME